MCAVFVIAASLLVLDKMLKLFNFVATKGGPVGVVFKMLANLLPKSRASQFPSGSCSASSSPSAAWPPGAGLDVMRGGLSTPRCCACPILFTVVLAALNLLIVGYLQPLSRYDYEQLQFRILALGCARRVDQGGRVQHAAGPAPRCGSMPSRDEGRDLRGIFCGGSPARTGRSSSFPPGKDSSSPNEENPDTVILRLSEGQIVQDGPGITSPRVLTFATHDLPIDLPRIERSGRRGERDREYFLPELLRIGWSKDSRARRPATRALPASTTASSKWR